MDVPSDLVAQFISVTDAPAAVASELLRDSGLDLMAAISNFFAIQEAGGLPPASSHLGEVSEITVKNGDASNNVGNDDAGPSPTARQADAAKQSPPASVSPPVESFHHPPSATGRPRRFPRRPTNPFEDSSLEDLFRKPTHLNYSYSFECARLCGQRQKKWLLVNMQRFDVFACYVMNRDVWSDEPLGRLLREHFIFWQRDEAAQDGADFKKVYDYQQAPHVALIDPRSGKRLRSWGGDGEPIEKEILKSALAEFVQTKSLAESDASPGSPPCSDLPVRMSDAELAAAIAAGMERRGNIDGDADTAEDRTPSRLLSVTNRTLNRSRNVNAQEDNALEGSRTLDREKDNREHSEAEQVKKVADDAAQKAKTATETREVNAQGDTALNEGRIPDHEKELREHSEAERVKKEAKDAALKAKTGAETLEVKRDVAPDAPGMQCPQLITELAIRLPTGKRLQRKFYASDNIGHVYDYVESEVEQLSERNFELMQTHPRKSLTDKGLRLGELGPKAVLIVHLKA